MLKALRFILMQLYKDEVKEIVREKKVSREIALGLAVRGNKTKAVIFFASVILVLIVTLISCVFMVYLSIMSMIGSLNTMAVASYTAVDIIQENRQQTPEELIEENGWTWEPIIEGADPILPVPGQPQIINPIIRNRSEIIQALDKACDDAEKVNGFRVEVPWMLGLFYRESGNTLYATADALKVDSIFSDLLYSGCACGKSNCSWIAAGHSHFVGGAVVGNVDKGDPYTQRINTNQSLYDQFGGDHAVGIMQFEIPYLDGKLRREYGNTSEVSYHTDADLGFIRPNAFYMPDALYNAVFAVTSGIRNSTSDPSNYANIFAGSDFQSLSKYNQDFIKFMYLSTTYGRGYVSSSTDDMAYALIDAVKSDKCKTLDEMIMHRAGEYFDSGGCIPKGSWRSFQSHVLDEDKILNGYGLGRTYTRGSTELPYVYWYGVYSACVGKVAYSEYLVKIEEAEVEEGGELGNWIGYKGSGVFDGGSSEYYLAGVGVRWYRQTSRTNTVNGKSWGGLRIPGTASSGKPATMASGGCGIYTLAMIASNLRNEDVTPDIALSSLGGQHMAACLLDSGVPVLANNLGLTCQTIDFASKTNDACLDVIKTELSKGNLILFVAANDWKGANYDPTYLWYSGKGHFMAIRGITNEGKLLVMTSTGNSHLSLSAEQLMCYPIPVDVFKNNLSTNRTYFWSVGLK